MGERSEVRRSAHREVRDRLGDHQQPDHREVLHQQDRQVAGERDGHQGAHHAGAPCNAASSTTPTTSERHGAPATRPNEHEPGARVVAAAAPAAANSASKR